MRIAWFSPLPPTRSGVAAYSVGLVGALSRTHVIDCFVDHPRAFSPGRDQRIPAVPFAAVFSAHDFVWKQQRNPYDLVVYHLGNAPCHDYVWAYVARYPGLVVLHDVCVHHARARHLLQQKRFDDYRAEFWFDHPAVTRDVVEYAVEGLGGSIYYFWSMLGVIMQRARAIAVHNRYVAGDLRAQYPHAFVEPIRMGVSPGRVIGRDRRAALRSNLGLPDDGVVFTAFGKVTAEKRVGVMLRALGRLVAEGVNAWLLLVGDASEDASLLGEAEQLAIADRVRSVGYVPDDLVDDFLAASDVTLCLRWPTAGETSASWLRCLAASRPTVITDLAQLVDVPTLDPRSWQPSLPGRRPVAVAIDLLEENRSLWLAMRRLALDPQLAAELGAAGHEFWATRHTMEAMVADYMDVMGATSARPAPRAADLPPHFAAAHAELAHQIARQLGVAVDFLNRG